MFKTIWLCDNDYIQDEIILNVARTGRINAEELAKEHHCSTAAIYKNVNELLGTGCIVRRDRADYLIPYTTQIYAIDRSEMVHNNRIFVKYIAPHLNCYKEFDIAPHLIDYSQNEFDIWRLALNELFNDFVNLEKSGALKISIYNNLFGTTIALYDNGSGIINKLNVAYPTEAFGNILERRECEVNKSLSGNGLLFASKLLDGVSLSFHGRRLFFKLPKDARFFPNWNVIHGGEDSVLRMALYDQRVAYNYKTCFGYDYRGKDQEENIADVLNICLAPSKECKHTTIVIKAAINSAPASVFAANELCKSFDGFSAITLDFDEVDWVSPSFMQELFVEYQRKHPEMSIKPINMNETVENMYHYIIRSAICE